MGSSLVLRCMPRLACAERHPLRNVHQVPKVDVARLLFEHPDVEVDVVEVVVHVKVQIVEGAYKGEHRGRFFACGDGLAHARVADDTVDVGISIDIAKHHVDIGAVCHRKDQYGVAVAIRVLAHAGNMDVLVCLKVDGELFLRVGT